MYYDDAVERLKKHMPVDIGLQYIKDIMEPTLHEMERNLEGCDYENLLGARGVIHEDVINLESTIKQWKGWSSKQEQEEIIDKISDFEGDIDHITDQHLRVRCSCK